MKDEEVIKKVLRTFPMYKLKIVLEIQKTIQNNLNTREVHAGLNENSVVEIFWGKQATTKSH